MIHDLRILSEGPDLAAQALAALQSPAVGALLGFRAGHFDRGHDQGADDATPYRQMLAHFARNFLQPIVDRTDGNPVPQEVEAAATAALKGAALLLALADKAHRHAARLRAAEAAQRQQEN